MYGVFISRKGGRHNESAVVRLPTGHYVHVVLTGTGRGFDRGWRLELYGPDARPWINATWISEVFYGYEPWYTLEGTGGSIAPRARLSKGGFSPGGEKPYIRSDGSPFDPTYLGDPVRWASEHFPFLKKGMTRKEFLAHCRFTKTNLEVRRGLDVEREARLLAAFQEEHERSIRNHLWEERHPLPDLSAYGCKAEWRFRRIRVVASPGEFVIGEFDSPEKAVEAAQIYAAEMESRRAEEERIRRERERREAEIKSSVAAILARRVAS